MCKEILENVPNWLCGDERSWKTPWVTGCTWVGVDLPGFTALSVEPRADAIAPSVLLGILQANMWPHSLLDQRDIYCCEWSCF